MTVEWRSLTYDVPLLVKDKNKPNEETKRILHGLSGYAAAGQVVAVMGPSGSGKTSLIHIIGGRRESGVSGDFVVNGEHQSSPRCLLGEMGYVTQEAGDRPPLLPYHSHKRSSPHGSSPPVHV